MISRPAKRLYRFGPFSLDPAEHKLLRDGESIPLRPKEFAVLLALVENHGHVLTKDQLLKGVWAGQFVEEGNLNRHISSLRRVLGESSTHPSSSRRSRKSAIASSHRCERFRNQASPS